MIRARMDFLWLSSLLLLVVELSYGFQSVQLPFGRRFYNTRTQFEHRPTLVLYQSINPTSDGLRQQSSRIQQRDVVIIGGGLAGLSTALYLSQIDPKRHVTVLERQDPASARVKTTAGSFAAAGMLAPQSERLPKGHLLDLCLASRRMYSDFCGLVESLAKESGSEGERYLWDATATDEERWEPSWSVGYVASGGFLAPAFAGDSVATWAPPEESGSAVWLDATQVRELEPNLHPDVVGGWWFPEDASVDARRLTCSLRAACIASGVELLMGNEYEITSLDLVDQTCQGIWIKSGRCIKTNAILLANGSWMRNLLPVPVEPHKGQSLSLRMPKGEPPMLRRVLFAQDSYIVPKADGRIVVGATVEAGSYDPNVTPAGLLHILSHALQLVPGLKDLPIEETWAGLRPTTPDKGPILGKTRWNNLYLAGGYWRNGVLLAPKTGQLLATLISGQPLTESDQDLLDAFSWDRFLSADGGVAMSANARYAASMHPIHQRRSGSGVAASVGTELGSYSSARSARDERFRDRSGLLDQNDSTDAAFERAAALGKSDSAAYIFGRDETQDGEDQEEDGASTSYGTSTPTPANVSGVPVLEADGVSLPRSDLQSVYDMIKTNKAKAHISLADSASTREERPDPGYRIYFVDPDTEETIEVPPYTSPGEFFESLSSQLDVTASSATTLPTDNRSTTMTTSSVNVVKEEEESQHEKVLDGYQAILEAHAGKSREAELQAMREARALNRLGQSKIDESQIGAIHEEQQQVDKEPLSSGDFTESNENSYEDYHEILQANGSEA